MAICRHCHKEKDFFATKCPHCTGDSTLRQQTDASIGAFIGQVIGLGIVIWLISLLFD